MEMQSNSSSWSEFDLPRFSPIAESRHFDVVIVGGGITGLTAGLILAKEGKSVCILERDRLGFGDTGNTTAHITYVTDPDLTTLAKTFGMEGAGLAWQAGAIAIDAIESIVEEQQIDCEWRRVPAYRHLPVNSKDESDTDLRKELETIQKLGFAADFVEEAPFVKRPGIRFTNQGLFHPMKYLAGLARALCSAGGQIYEESEVKEIEGDPNRITVNGHAIVADKVIIATHVPVVGKASLLSAGIFQSKLAGYATYAVEGRTKDATLHSASFWDTADPYHYLRIDTQGDDCRLILGGSDHKPGQCDDTEKCFEDLENLLLHLFPMATIGNRWTGEVIEPNDGLPFIGEMEKGQFIATGFSGNGMTFGTFAAIMAREWVEGKTNVWQDLFSLERRAVLNAPFHYLKENADYPYYLIKDRLGVKKVEDSVQVEPGTGRIRKRGDQYVAIACADDGIQYELSALCTHMGCLVRWNTAAKTWDCPCHGSRFNIDGTVIEGPAETPLKPLQIHRE